MGRTDVVCTVSAFDKVLCTIASLETFGRTDGECTLLAFDEVLCTIAGLETAAVVGVVATRASDLSPCTGKILIGFVPSVGTQ